MAYRTTWTADLAGMADYGPDLQLTAHCGTCGTWEKLRVDDWAQAYGWDFSFWDWREPCAGCGRDLTFLVSPGPTTPLLPMRTLEGELAALRADRLARGPAPGAASACRSSSRTSDT